MIAADVAQLVQALAWAFLGLAALIVAVGVMIALIGGRRVAGHITTKLVDLDLAVNNRPGPKLIEQVDWLAGCMSAVAHHLKIDLPNRPDATPPPAKPRTTRTRVTDRKVTP